MRNRSAAVLLDALLPQATLAQNALLIIGGSLLVALGAQVSLPLPFRPVPVTGQTFAVLLLGATLGARRSAAALLLYLVEGASGLPVFAPGGLPGMARLAGLTGGYLLSFPLAAFLVGLAVERLPRRWWTWLTAALAAEALILAAGTSWLKLLTQADWAEAARLGAWPFLPGSVLKAVLVALCLPASWWAVEKSQK